MLECKQVAGVVLLVRRLLTCPWNHELPDVLVPGDPRVISAKWFKHVKKHFETLTTHPGVVPSLFASLSEGVGVVRWLEAIRKRPPFWAILCARWSSLGGCQFRPLPCGFRAEFTNFVLVPMIDCSYHLPTHTHTFIHISWKYVKLSPNISTSTTIQIFGLGASWPQQKRFVKLSSSASLSFFVGIWRFLK